MYMDSHFPVNSIFLSYSRLIFQILVKFHIWWLVKPYPHSHSIFYIKDKLYTSSTALGGGGSFKNRKPIGGIGCCDSRMEERSHWWTDRWLRSLLFLSLSFSFSDYLPTYLSIYVSIYLTIHPSIYLSLSLYLSIHLSIYLSLSLPLSIYRSIDLSIYSYLFLSIPIYSYLFLSIPIYSYLFLSIPIYSYLFLSIPISSYLFLSLPIYSYLFLFIPIYSYLFLSIPIYSYLSLSIPIYPYLFLSIPIYSYLFLSIPIYSYLFLSIPIYSYLSISSVYLTMYLTIDLSIYRPIYLSLCLSIYLSISKLENESSGFELDNIKNAAILRDFLNVWTWQRQKQSNSARLRHFSKLTTSKTKQFCETSLIFQLDNVKNDAILRDFVISRSWQHQKRKNSARLPSKMESCVQSRRADGLVPMRFAIFPVHLSKLLRLPRKSDARSYEVLHLSRKIISATWRSDAPKCNPSQEITARTS